MARSQIKFDLFGVFFANFGWSHEPLSWRCGTAPLICGRMIPCIIAFLITREWSNIDLFLGINLRTRCDLICANSCHLRAFSRLHSSTWAKLLNFIALDKILNKFRLKTSPRKVTYLVLILLLILYFNVNFGKKAKTFGQRLIHLR